MDAKRIVLIVALYVIPLSGVGTDLYSPSLPAIVKGLMAPVSLVKLTLAVYLFGFSFGQFLNGTLSDIYGRRPILLLSLALFTLASLAVTQVNNIYFLLFARVIQGLAAAGPSVIAKALITDTMTGRELKKASIYLVTVWGISPIIAPGIGGYLQEYIGWHANFYFFAAYAFSMYILTLLLLKETNLNLAEFKWNKIRKNYREILLHRVFLANVFCMAFTYSTIMIFNIFTPFLVQTVLGYSAITYGHMAMLIGASFLVGTISNRWLMARFDTRKINRIGVISVVIVAILMMIMVYSTKMTLLTLAAPVLAIVFIVGLLQTNFMSHNLSLFPHMGGAASAVIGGVLCLIAGLVTTGASFVAHTSSQLPVSWIYTGIIGLYAVTYWVILDTKIIEL